MKSPIQPKIIIGMASEDIMHVSTAHAIGCAIIGDPNIIDFLIYKGCDIVSARTYLVKEAIKKGATHLCFIDSDMTFPKDTIRQLLAHNKEIISVEYNKRMFPLEKVTKPLKGTEASETELYKAYCCGAGMLLIDLSIFEKLAKPWFNFGRDSDGKMNIGEDAWFIHTAQDAGYDTWVDPTIKCGHIGEYIF